MEERPDQQANSFEATDLTWPYKEDGSLREPSNSSQAFFVIEQ
jgi:hypothetical protein